jgi:hypothetical protein
MVFGSGYIGVRRAAFNVVLAETCDQVRVGSEVVVGMMQVQHDLLSGFVALLPTATTPSALSLLKLWNECAVSNF